MSALPVASGREVVQAHVDFPEHPITRGVTLWKINDGWLNEFQFVDGMQGVTPLVWSGKVYGGSRSGRGADVVGWAYERPGGDGHSDSPGSTHIPRGLWPECDSLSLMAFCGLRASTFQPPALRRQLTTLS